MYGQNEKFNVNDGDRNETRKTQPAITHRIKREDEKYGNYC